MLHPFDVRGSFPVSHSSNFVQIHRKFTLANYMAKILHLLLAKITLLKFSMKLVLPQAIKHLPEVLLVLLCIPIGIHQNVIQVDTNKVINVTSHNFIHKPL